MFQKQTEDSDVHFVQNVSEVQNLLTDPYLSYTRSTNRLIEEYKKYGSLIVAYDFDDTIFDFHGKGYAFLLVAGLIRKLKEINCHLICYTGNDDLEMITDYLKTNEIPFDSINEQFPSYPNQSSRKIYANAYLDDRAGLAQVFKQLSEVIHFATTTKVEG